MPEEQGCAGHGAGVGRGCGFSLQGAQQSSPRSRAGAHGAKGGQDRVNRALPSSGSAQASPRVPHPQSLCQHLEGPQMKRLGGDSPGRANQGLLHLFTNEVRFSGLPGASSQREGLTRRPRLQSSMW